MADKPPSTDPTVAAESLKKGPSPQAPINEPVTNASASTTTTTTTTTTTNNTVDPPKTRKPGYTNPAFRAMGIPALRLPSRNWSIFWLVVSAGVGGYAYDRYQVKQIRKKWMTRVEHLGQTPLQPNVTARKVTVYVAPPPNDYLDESLAVFRRYVKPVLNASGVDFEVKSENRQGVIRSLVAADVRSIRRDYLEAERKKKELEVSQRWYNRVKSWFSKKDLELTKDEINAEFNYKQLLGTYYRNETWKNSEIIDEDSLVSDPTCQGGVICIGRGAYKEYLTGLHEGLLGPLEKPVDHDEFEKPQDQESQELGVPTINSGTAVNDDAAAAVVSAGSSTSTVLTDASGVETVSTTAVAPEVKALDDVTTTLTTKEDSNTTLITTESPVVNDKESTEESKEESTPEQDETSDFDGKKDENALPIPKPFISPSEYPTASYAPELPAQGVIKTHGGVSAVFQQPILVIPVYHLLGFLQTPWRIYRFYNQRAYAEEYGRGAVAVVENVRSRYQLDHVDWAKGEEEDWPNKWVEKGKAKNSEWTQELITDGRVLEKLWVYDAGKIVESKGDAVKKDE